MSNEIFKPVPITPYNINYEISNLGNVRRTTSASGTCTGKLLKKEITRNKYQRVCLYYRSESKHILVHRLVAMAFIPNPKNFPQINHINGNKNSNTISNLEWCTPQQNGRHAALNNLTAKGEEQGNSKLTAEQVEYIRRYYRKGQRDFSQRTLAKKFGVSYYAIYSIVNNKTWKHIS